MTDINNNFGGDVGKIHGVDFERTAPLSGDAQIYSAPEKQIDDLDKAHSALVGRSMVKKMKKAPAFNGELAARIKGDLAALDANYAKNKKAVHLTDIALEKGVPYEKALEIGEEFTKL